MMKINRITQAISVLALASMMPALAADESGWYLGIGGGSARATIAQEDIIADLLASGYETSQFRTDSKDGGYKLYAGYQFNRHIALEGGYFDLGTFNYTATTIPSGTQSGELDFDGWNINLLGFIPLTKRSSIYGSIGAHRSEASVNFVGTGAVNILTPHYEKTTTDYKFGVGFQYRIVRSVYLRLEGERYSMDDAVGNKGEIELYSLNLLYRFGGQPPTRPEPRRAPDPAPAPAPATPPAAEAVSEEQYCGALEIQFEVANDDIQRIHHEHIQVLANFLNRYPETRVLVEGHTDNVGSEADNLRLSQQRAQSVVDYLIKEHDIDSERLEAIGYGETQPLEENYTEAGKRANRRINAVIDCATDIEGLVPLPARITLVMELEFDTDSSEVNARYHSQLSRVADYLLNNPALIATMEGHTDNANPEIAERLSLERAQSVADYLVEHFEVPASRLHAEGFGATRRTTYNITVSDRMENRRVHIIMGYDK